MTQYMATIFINGYNTTQNYSRGNKAKVTQITMNRRAINDISSLNLTIQGAIKASDTNLLIGAKIYFHTGSTGTSTDKIWHKFQITNVKWKSDGTCNVEAKTSASRNG